MADDASEIDLPALDAYLKSDASPKDCLLLSGLDGFLAGIAVGPEPLPASEWMPVIWCDEEPEFASEQQRRTILGTTLGRYDEIAATLSRDPDSFEPILDPGPNGARSVIDWATGFIEAVKLCWPAWQGLYNHPRANILLVPLIILGDKEDFFDYQRRPREREFYASRPHVLRTCAVGIYDFWQDQRPDRQRPHPRRQRGVRR